jgi:outer membrane protein assembly factor BamD (BamD/ComL family)
MFQPTLRANRRLAGCMIAALCGLVAGCKSTPIDVAKGHPTEPEGSLISSDYQPHEDDDWWSPQHIGKQFKKAVGLGPDQRLAQQKFEEGQKLFAAKRFSEAASKFASAASRGTDTAIEEDAMFFEAESYFFADRYSKADDMYGELLKKYPNTRYLNKSTARQFSIARYWQEYDKAHPHWPLTPNLVDRTRPLFDTGGHSINAFDNVRVNDPRGPLADSAIMAVANTYFEKGRYEDADYYYGLLRSDYPKSNYQLQSHLLGLQCKLRKYQGPNYNGKPLEEANQLINQMLVQFPTELGSERDWVVKAKAEVQAQRATRDIHLAQFFDNGKHYGAARIYYAQVIKDYPQTPFSEQAKTRLAAIQGEPDNPPNPVAFLKDWIDPKDPRDIAPADARGTAIAQRTAPADGSAPQDSATRQ